MSEAGGISARPMSASGSATEEARAALYLTLAEALDEPPSWLPLPGREWPLCAAAAALQDRSAAAATAVAQLAPIPEERPADRLARYRSLFATSEQPPLSLYESMSRGGRLLGSESMRVERFYHAAGLVVPPGELPDHACLELAFLAHLSQQATIYPNQAAQWRRIERQFARRHPGRWLPQLGRALADSGDMVYAPIGELLASWLAEVTSISSVPPPRPATRLPVVAASSCTLCGFCVQVCPDGALAIHEDDGWTSLELSAARCSGCARCAGTCPAGALQLRAAPANKADGDASAWRSLRRSPRLRCRACARPTVSQAELTFVASQIGHPPWLDYCLECRT